MNSAWFYHDKLQACEIHGLSILALAVRSRMLTNKTTHPRFILELQSLRRERRLTPPADVELATTPGPGDSTAYFDPGTF